MFPVARNSRAVLRPLAPLLRRSLSDNMNFFQRQILPVNTVIKFVPQQQAWVVERMGKFYRILKPGVAFLAPFVDRISYVQNLKETAVEVPRQNAITADNVTLDMDGVLYVRVFDAFKASYGVEDAQYAISQLAQTTMRSEIGKLTLQQVLKERQSLNWNITEAINEAADAWGISCLRYEIKDIRPPASVVDAMHRQVSAERSKRAEILESEGHRQAVILAADATAEGLRKVASAIETSPKGTDAVSLQLADKYIESFGKLAKEGTGVVIPAQLGDIGAMVAGGLSIFDRVKQTRTSEQKKIDSESPESAVNK